MPRKKRPNRKKPSVANAKPKPLETDVAPHNGEGVPPLQFPDPVNGQLIGGQVAVIRMSMRVRHTVYPWARRQGKTRSRQFLYVNEAALTSGTYYSGIVFPDHTTAAKVANVFRKSWGGLVQDYKINDKDQDRWIKLGPIVPPDQPPPSWFTPRLKRTWAHCSKPRNRNEGSTIYFWGGAHPHYEKIQGFPHPFHRVDYDECQLLHPLAYGPVRPMIRDVRGSETWSGTPWVTGIGNSKFEYFWGIAKPGPKHWFGMRLPDGCNPHVPPVSEEEMVSMTRHEILQTMHARFLTGEGAVFGNLANVFIVKPMHPEHPDLAWVRSLRARYNMPSVEWWIAEPEPRTGHTYAASIDWARSPTGDYSVLSVFDFTTNRQVALLRWRGEDFTAQMEVVLAVCKIYGASELHSDANGMGETMSDFIRKRHSLGFIGHKFGRNKADYVRRAQILFQDADVFLIDCPIQKQEFKNFAAHEGTGIGSEKQIKFCAPQGENDDTVASFLHLTISISISGRRDIRTPDPLPEPVYTADLHTTLERLAQDSGVELPSCVTEGASRDLTWDSVVLPR